MNRFGRALERVDGCLGRTLLRLFALPFLAGGLLATYHGVEQAWTAWSARGWPAVQGEIVRSALKGRAFDVRYHYAVDGQPFESHRVHVGQFSGLEGYARGIVSRHPAGSRVAVFYDPAHPSSAVLEHRMPWTSVLLTAMGLTLLAAAWACLTSRAGLSDLMSHSH